MSDKKITVGTPVLFKQGDVLVRKGVYTGSGRRAWERFREQDARFGNMTEDFMNEPRIGYIIGQRTLSNGDFTKGWSGMSYEGEWDGEANEYHPTESFQAYLVVEGLRSRPVKLRIEDVEVTW